VDDTVSIAIRSADSSQISDWNVYVLDPAGNPFKRFAGEGAPESPVVWDGRSATGELVQSAYNYPLIVSVTNTRGNRSEEASTLPVDVLVLKDGDRLRIVISSIYFKPYTADYRDVDPALAARNAETLDRLAQILAKFATYKIQVEGHAVRIYWNDPARGRAEETAVLGPLSTERANVIESALVSRGIADARMSTVGYGGAQPIVPHGDLANRWKNRRVEFVLYKN
jgi:flagellar motor protein MotB